MDQGTGTQNAALTQIASDYMAAKARVKELNDLKKNAQAVVDNLAEQIINHMVNSGLTGFKTDDRSFFLKKKVWANMLRRDLVVKYFEENQLEGMVTVYAATLSSWVAERVKEGLGIPDELASALDVKDKIELASRKA